MSLRERFSGGLAARLGLKRHSQRLAVRWEVAVRGDGDEAIFPSRDVSLFGIRLESPDRTALRRVQDDDGRIRLRLTVPGHPEPFWVKAEFRWGFAEQEVYTTGWKFCRLPLRCRRLLEAYIRAHPDLNRPPADALPE